MFAKYSFFCLLSLFSFTYLQDIKSMQEVLHLSAGESPVDVFKEVNEDQIDRLISLLEAYMQGSLDVTQTMVTYSSYTGSGKQFCEESKEIIIDLENVKHFLETRVFAIQNELTLRGPSCLDKRTIEIDVYLQLLWFFDFIKKHPQNFFVEGFNERVQNLKKEVATY
jgi:hypothetical protein